MLVPGGLLQAFFSAARLVAQLQHDFVASQYQAGDYKASGSSPQKLTLRSIAPTPGHARQVNLVVFDGKTGSTLQALSLQCTT